MVISSKILAVIAVVIIAVAAVAAWQIYPTLNHQTTAPTPTPTPTPKPTPTATPTPTPKPTTKTTSSSSSSTSSSSSSSSATPTPTPEPQVLWNLNFTGGNSINMTNIAFESLATTQGVTYAQNDSNSNTTWTGIPLYQLVNYYTDSGNISYGVLSLGYNVTVIASDNFTQTFNSTRVIDNPNMIVANTGNGTALNGIIQPLQLTGSNMTKRECVKNLTQIRIDTLLPVNMTLTVKGYNGTTITFNRNDIAALPTLSQMGGRNTHGNITAVGNYTGISVSYLANLVGGLPNATYKINIVAADGYVIPISYSQVVNGTGYSMYNQTTNAAQNPTLPITPVLAYAFNGSMLPYGYYDNGTINTTGVNEGPFRLMYLGPEGLLMSSSPSVRWAVEVDVVNA